MSRAEGNIKSILRTSVLSFTPEEYKYYIEWLIKNFGMKRALKQYVKLFIKNILLGEHYVMIKVPDSNFYLTMRPTLADLETYRYVFMKQEYEYDYTDAEYIIDAGAHIGLVSTFFSLKYPEAKILSIEPEDTNYQLLVTNTKRFPNIKPIKAALWSHKTFVNILNSDVADWEYRVAAAQNNSGITAITVEDAMSDLGAEHIDILKIDIEGAEIEVFKTSNSWIDRIKSIILETHDRFRPGCTQAVETAITGRNFDLLELPGCIALVRQQESDNESS
jgi:FkbM family methyltransferase